MSGVDFGCGKKCKTRARLRWYFYKGGGLGEVIERAKIP